MSDLLDTSEQELASLKKYLRIKHGMRGLGGIRLRHDVAQDRANRRNPRAFCYTVKGSKIIRATQELEWVGPQARIGILLHEILHIWLPAFGDDAEIKVDSFATTELKETGYKYADLTYFTDKTGVMKECKAKAIEQVSMKFVHILGDY